MRLVVTKNPNPTKITIQSALVGRRRENEEIKREGKRGRKTGRRITVMKKDYGELA